MTEPGTSADGQPRKQAGRSIPAADHADVQHVEGELLRDRLADANFASAIYGQILVLSLLAALGGHDPSARTVLAAVVSTQLVFWLGHAYAEIVARQVKSGRPNGFKEAVHVLQEEWPLVQAAFPTAVLMTLALAGVLKTVTALDLAIGIGLLQLLGFGYLVGRRSGRPPLGQLTVAVLSGAFGLVIVLLKAAIH